MNQPIDFDFWKNFPTYSDYLASDLWKARANEYKRKIGYQCEYVGCNIYNAVEVHHVNYKRLGRERDIDLICLCKKHHEEWHK